MQGSKIITVVVLITLTVVGWVSFVFDSTQQQTNYETALSEADKDMEQGLYQLAIKKYGYAVEYKSTAENWNKLISAYEKRFAEDETLSSDYIKILNKAITKCGFKENFVIRLSELYVQKNNYKNAYSNLVNAEKAGTTSENLQALKRKVLYTFTVKRREFSSFFPQYNSVYSAFNGTAWGSANANGSQDIPFEYRFISPATDSGIRLFVDENESKLIDANGVLLAILKFSAKAAGGFSDGLIPVMKDDTYYYYNSYGEEQFGGYEKAGSFVNGKAAVKKDGKWAIINNSGEYIDDKRFADIRLALDGCYITESTVLAASEEGAFRIYNSKWEPVEGFSCEDIDVCTSDKIIAYKSSGKWGFADTSGKIIIEPQYEEAKSFSNGLAAVCQNGAWGFIDTDNNVVIDCKFAGADYFNEEGSCMVRTDEPNIDDEVIWQLIALKLGIAGGKKH